MLQSSDQMPTVLSLWRQQLGEALGALQGWQNGQRWFYGRLYLFFLVLNLACYWWAMFTAFPELTQGSAGRHYFWVQMPVGVLGALFDSLSYFVTLWVVRRALEQKSTWEYVGHLALDGIIAIVAIFWVLFVFAFSGWLVGLLEADVVPAAAREVLTRRSTGYRGLLMTALLDPAGNLRNLYFGAVMGMSAAIPTLVHLALFARSVLITVFGEGSMIARRPRAGVVGLSLLLVLPGGYIASANLLSNGTSDGIEFAEVRSGELATAIYVGKNEAAESVVIEEVETSCGCTVAEYPKEEIGPGEEFRIIATVNTVYKTGLAKKTMIVRFKGDVLPPKRIKVFGSVLPRANPEQAHKEGGQGGFFGAECAACHVNPGKGLRGYKLYLADCAFCHGVFGNGRGDAPMAFGGETKDKERLRAAISGGTPGKMPAFGQAAGGPLDEGQIDSLVDLAAGGMPIFDFEPKPYFHSEYSLPWLKERDDITRGWRVYAELCKTCHGPRGVGGIGPAIDNDNQEELRRIIATGTVDGLMPAFAVSAGGPLTEEDLSALVAFLTR